MPASLAASARLMPSSALAIASMRSAARRFGSCRARRRSAEGASSSRMAKAAPIAPSRSPFVGGTVPRHPGKVSSSARRYHPEVYHPDEGRPFPALVALVTDAVTGEPMTVHKTYLAPDGSGKAAVAKPRLLCKGGAKAGGVVRLWPDEAVTTGLLVAEGIETALSAALGF